MEEKNLSKGQKSYLKRIVNEFKNDAESVLGEIKSLKNQLNTDIEENSSLLEKSQDIQEDINIIKNRITDLNNEIFIPKIEGQNSLSDNIHEFESQFRDSKAKISIIIQEINSYKNKLFGYENEDGEEIKGLQQKIENQIIKLNDLHEKSSIKQNKLFDEIEKLLKGASTVALAASFKEHKDSFNTANYLWMFAFISSIVSMMIVSIYVFQKAEFEIQDMWKGTVGNLPFIGGSIWIAIYSSKQRSQNKRLQQEYAFKEDVAKIYYGLKKEIEELDDTELGEMLNKRVLELIVDVVSLNPSETLESKSHNDKGPILEALNNLSSLVKNNQQ